MDARDCDVCFVKLMRSEGNFAEKKQQLKIEQLNLPVCGC